MSGQIVKPCFSNEFSIGGQILDFVSPKHVQKLVDEMNALLGIGIALFRKEGPEYREGDSLMHHG